MNVSVRVNPLRELAKSGQSVWLDTSLENIEALARGGAQIVVSHGV